MLPDPALTYNERTGAYRILLVNGDPVESDDLAYACLSMLCEDPGWFMEETPREGNLVEALSLTTARGTRSETKAAMEQRLRHLVDEGVLVDAYCDSVQTVDLESGGRGIVFSAKVQRPGQSPQAIQVQLRGT
jgi:hypothetical protein